MPRPPLLSPHNREILLDALRPPSGYRLDRAVGTSYSVDLMSGLLVPMAFALFDTERKDARTDPVAVLAATQTYASRVSIYCEQGRIAAAVKGPRVLAYLERTLKPVPPPRGGSFHPKLWVLRFASDRDSSQLHRVLCLSRNLTFDRSWDSILRLEQSDKPDESQAKPLIAFLRELNSLAPSGHARELIRSLRGVAFDPPFGFDSVSFAPITPKLRNDPIGSGERLLVVSPFLGAQKLGELAADWKRVDLASRAVTMDQLGGQALAQMQSTYAFTTLEAEEASEALSESTADASGLAGLHAKLFAGDADGHSFLVVGSANCSSAAFNRNVEFCVRLDARSKRSIPAALLRDHDNNSGLRALLEPYEAPDTPIEASAQETELERLDDLRREIADLAFRTEVVRTDRGFDLKLRCDETLPPLSKGDVLRAWPITLPKGDDRLAGDDPLASWTLFSAAKVTSLICFELKSKMSGVPALGFTLMTELVGDLRDDERFDAVLAETLDDPKRLMQFLLLLLAAGADDHGLGDIAQYQAGTPSNNGDGEQIDPWSHIPLMETLVRTYAREPGRLEPFRRAIEALTAASKRAGTPLPELEAIWHPVNEALGKSKGPQG